MKNNFQVGETYLIENIFRADVSQGSKIELYPISSFLKYKNGATWTNIPSGTAWMRLYRSGYPSPFPMKISFWTSSNTLISDVTLTDGDFKIFGEFILISPSQTDDADYIYYRNHSRQASMYFELCKLNCEPHVVSKTSGTNLLLVDYAFGTPREEFNVLTPSITFEYDNVPDFNYVYIPSLSRYYFVTNITLVRNNIYRIDLKVDVLCTYDSDIRLQTAFVLRQENTYDSSIFDDRLPTRTNMGWEYYDVNVLYPTPNYNCKNVSFDQTSSSGYRWVVSALTKNTPKAESHGVTAPTNSDLSNITSVYPANVSIGSKLLYYALDLDAGCYFSNAIMKDSTLASYVLSFVYYPFDVTSITQKSSSGSYSYVVVNDKTLTDYLYGTFESGSMSGTAVTSAYDITNMGYAIIADFTLPSSSNYKDYEPYCYYELWVPFVGWVKLNSVDIVGKRIIVYYAIDIGSGMATAYVKQWSTDTPLFSATCQIGSRLPITTTNEEQLTRQKQNNVLNLAVGLLGSGVSTAIGLATENPIAMVGGVLSATKSIASYVNANNMLFETAQTSLFSSETSLYSQINKVMMRVRYHEVVDNFVQSDYGHLQGYPAKTYMSLSSLTGYTEIPEMHYVPSTYKFITKTEIDEIVSLAKNGIIL